MSAIVNTIPLTLDPQGAYRVGGTRVTLDLVVRAFNDGATAEQIVQKYDTLQLPDVYQVIGYYLKHADELTEYFQRRERQEQALLSAHPEIVAKRSSRAVTSPPEDPVKWLADECFDNDIVRGLLRRSPNLDLIRAQDVIEIARKDDKTLLAWATKHKRIVLTHDLATMIPTLLYQQQQASGCTPIVLVSDSLPIGAAIEDILLLDQCSESADWVAGVVYLPFPLVFAKSADSLRSGSDRDLIGGRVEVPQAHWAPPIP